MILLARILILRDLEIFQVIRNRKVLAYSIIEDTRILLQKKTKNWILYA